MKIGLFFGSFNPIHIGHLTIANLLVEMTELDKVWFVVSPHNPFKKRSNLLHEFDRIDMVRLAIADNPNFDVTDVEFHMPRPSYTIDTLAYLSDKYPQHRFQPIIGGDNLKHFKKWKNHQQLLDNFGLIVYPRPDFEENLHNFENIQIVKDVPLMEISATLIRKLIREGKSIKYLVHDDVASLIHFKKLYL